MKLVIKTPAKINLGLHILRKRADGYHDLETILQMVSLYDTLELETLAGGEVVFTCDQPGIPLDDSNLALKALRLLQSRYPQCRAAGARIHLRKSIPAGAGLGGGSGNAAGALLGLNVLWNLRLGREELAALGALLGADVPFFLTSPCALGEDRGERLTPLPPPRRFAVLIVYPGFPVATAWAYRQFKLDLTKKANNITIVREFLSQSALPELGGVLRNDLEPFVLSGFPEIARVKEWMRTGGAAGVLMSGSGSTVFGIFPSVESAAAVARRERDPKWNLFLTETVENLSEFLPEPVLSYP